MTQQMRSEIAAAVLAPVQITEMAAKQQFCFGSDFVGFSGHFPEFPILPAILQVLLAQMVAEKIVSAPVRLASLTRAKFRQQIKPDDQIDVQVKCKDKNGRFHCASELLVAGTIAATFTLVLTPELGSSPS